jgi:hypothetical protein
MTCAPDFAAQNAAVQELWRLYHEGKPSRVPMIMGLSSRFTVLNPALNPLGIGYDAYFNDPEVMWQHQLIHQDWVRHNLPQDAEMGLPEAWSVSVDFQNSYEALWWGAPLRFIDGDVPDTPAFVTGASKWEFVQRGAPDPFSGWMGRAWEYLELFRQKQAAGAEYKGRPVHAGWVPGAGTDGPFTIACALRGPTQVCLDIYEDPDFFHAFMGLLVEGTIQRMKAFRKRFDQPEQSPAWGFADDSVLLLSVPTYREHILPHHRRLFDEFGPQGPNSIHLCGDATHLFRTIRDELKVTSFDTGFPVDHGWLRGELGPEVTILGGPHVELLRTGTPAGVRAEVRRILESGVTEGGKFILREGNNLAPGTPVENVAAMYQACQDFGRYQES